MILYHGTRPENLDSIRERGLVAHKAWRGTGVWCTPDFDTAVHYSTPLLVTDVVGIVVEFELLDSDDAVEDRPARWLVRHGIDPARLRIHQDPVCWCHADRKSSLVKLGDSMAELTAALAGTSAALDEIGKAGR